MCLRWETESEAGQTPFMGLRIPAAVEEEVSITQHLVATVAPAS